MDVARISRKESGVLGCVIKVVISPRRGFLVNQVRRDIQSVHILEYNSGDIYAIKLKSNR